MSSLHQTDGSQCYSDIDESSSGNESIIINSYANDASKNTIKGNKRGNSRKKKKKVSKSQHSLDSLRQRVSDLMSIFEENCWFIPMPDFSSNNTISNQNQKDSKKKGGKVWSNRNYGADKKRQRKQSERIMLEVRIQQLEATLRNDHGVENL